MPNKMKSVPADKKGLAKKKMYGGMTAAPAKKKMMYGGKTKKK